MLCPGCGHGTIMTAIIRAIENLGLEKNHIAVISGIGCSARISGYLDFHTLHTLHGRALAFATGVKLSRPELTVIVPMGDVMPVLSEVTILSMPRDAISM